MFDPHHNAVNSYYLVNGSLKGSWEGLSKEVIIANWNSGKASDSLKFFAGRGHSQVIAGYYDADDLGNFRTWDAAARGVPGVFGFMYTTWQSKYSLLEQYGQAMRGAATPWALDGKRLSQFIAAPATFARSSPILQALNTHR